tara:strand:+ start:303 stop:713 length:411 start_codon:yes stop_codon:yes gene_type:complete
MTLIQEFGLIYTQHVYGDGLATPEFSDTDLTDRDNPRALARAVQYGDHDSQLYPHVTGVDVTTLALAYAVGTAPTNSVLDIDPPRLIDQHDIPFPIKDSLIVAGWISKFPLVNTGNMHTITDAGISQLRVASIIPA